MCVRSKHFVNVIRPLLVLAMVAATCSFESAHADGRRKKDHDDLYKARKSGAILPLAEILRRLRPVTGPEVVDVEFETRHDVPVYEIKYVDKSGRRKEIYVDARTAAVVEIGDD
ncbi:MAG: PepSY domain-containing protein [Nitratireductor sp.]